MNDHGWVLLNPCGCAAAIVRTQTESPEETDAWQRLFGAHSDGAEEIKVKRGQGFKIVSACKDRYGAIRDELAKASVRGGMPGRYTCRGRHELSNA